MNKCNSANEETKKIWQDFTNKLKMSLDNYKNIVETSNQDQDSKIEKLQEELDSSVKVSWNKLVLLAPILKKYLHILILTIFSLFNKVLPRRRRISSRK